MTPDTKLVNRTIASPNQEPRAKPIDMIVLHYTGMVDDDKACSRLCDSQSRVSSHYLIMTGGEILQLVPETQRAWHAGVSSWRGETDINSHSIGIEIANPGHDFGYPDFPRTQIEQTIALCRDIAARRHIAPARIVAHSDVAPSRKRDPGEKFPWAHLAKAGVGLWVEPTAILPGPELVRGDRGEPIRTLQKQLADFGYGLAATGEFDLVTEEVVMAFQRHFRPAQVDGIADHSTLDTLHRLLAARDAELSG
jgi:N-acetylmuramoyl-L-alanine amidase